MSFFRATFELKKQQKNAQLGLRELNQAKSEEFMKFFLSSTLHILA